MKTRVLTGILLAVVLIPLFILGGWYLFTLLALLTMGATYELLKLYDTNESLPKWVWVVEILLALGFYLHVVLYFRGDLNLEWVLVFTIGALVIGSFLLVFVEEFHSQRIGQLLFNVMYPALGFGAIFAIREDSIYAIGFIFLITVATDIFAYIVGINFGKHRLAIKISPKKSIEGSIGGTVAAVLFLVLYVFLVDLETLGAIELNVFIVIGLTIFLSAVGQIGDLVASKIKRHMGIKDFSNLFPGHGGIMDRFDSILLVAIVLTLVDLVVRLL